MERDREEQRNQGEQRREEQVRLMEQDREHRREEQRVQAQQRREDQRLQAEKHQEHLETLKSYRDANQDLASSLQDFAGETQSRLDQVEKVTVSKSYQFMHLFACRSTPSKQGIWRVATHLVLPVIECNIQVKIAFGTFGSARKDGSETSRMLLAAGQRDQQGGVEGYWSDDRRAVTKPYLITSAEPTFEGGERPGVPDSSKLASGTSPCADAAVKLGEYIFQ